MSRSVADSARRIAPLAWPVFVGQLSMLAFSTVDTVLVARHGTQDLAALAVGAAAYVTVFIGFMGVVLALGPIVGQLFGAGRLAEAGRQAHQAVWVALALSVVGCAALLFPAPFMALAQLQPEVEARARGYLQALAFALPGALLFTVYRGFNVAVSRPKAVMALQLGGLALKVPLSWALVAGVPALGLPALGVVGCGIATAIAVWSQVAAAVWVLRRDDFYARFALPAARALDAPDRRALATHLRLGLPMGAQILIEVTGFAFMALFIARLGSTAVAGHQIAANVVALLFMMPLAIGNGAGTLVAQRIGASDLDDARRLGWHALALAAAVAALMGGVLFLARAPLAALYTADAAVAAAALPLLGWVVLFHLADAVQAVAAFVLRAWRVATVPMLINAVALWGVGLVGGHALAVGAGQGADGYWQAATAGLVLAALLLAAFLARVVRRLAPRARPRPAGPA